MSFIKQQVAMLSDEELAKAFGEIRDWKKSSILSKGIVRNTHAVFEEHMNEEMDLRLTEEAFLYEMGRRFTQEFEKREREALGSFPLLRSPFQELQDKYMSRNVDGEYDSFDNEKLTEHNCWELHSDLIELFETGRYYTSNDTVLEQLKNFLNKEKIPYFVDEESIGYKYILKIKF